MKEEFEWLQEELTIDQECIFNHDALIRLTICKLIREGHGY
jgi:hypothetical protein